MSKKRSCKVVFRNDRSFSRYNATYYETIQKRTLGVLQVREFGYNVSLYKNEAGANMW